MTRRGTFSGLKKGHLLCLAIGLKCLGNFGDFQEILSGSSGKKQGCDPSKAPSRAKALG